MNEMRKCPYCGQLIKHYIFSSITIPFEHIAKTSAENSEENPLKYSFYTWGNNAFEMFSRVLLTSTCACGNISFWECRSNDIKTLISEDMRKEGYFIEVIYAKEAIQTMYNQTSNKEFKKDLEDVLKLFPENKGE